MFDCKVTISRDPELFERDHARFSREAFKKGARFHHETSIPRHFEKGADTKYGYSRRSSKANAGIFEAVGLYPWHPGEPRNQPYQAFKDKLGLPPLVLSGRLRDQVKTFYKITGTSTRGARLTMEMPSYAGGKTGVLRIRKGQTSVTDQQRNILARQAELQTYTSDEHAALVAQVQAEYARQADQPGVPKRLV